MSETMFETNRYATKSIISNWITIRPRLSTTESIESNVDDVETYLDLVDVYDN